jgi:hypothetical protein
MSAYPSGANVYTQGFGSYPENVEIPHIDIRDPNSTDYKFPLGKRWVNRIDDTEFVLTSFTASLNITSAVWIQSAGGVSGIITLTGDTGGAVGPSPAGNVNILGSETVDVTGNPGSNTLTIGATVRGFPVTPFVVGPSGFAGYQTIQSALNAAAANPAVIFLQPGSYTENLDFALNNNGSIEIVSLNRYAATITGVHIPCANGAISFVNLNLISTTDIFFNSDSGNTRLTLDTCQASCTNGFIFNVALWSGPIQILRSTCIGTQNGVVNNASGLSSTFIQSSYVGAGTTRQMAIAEGSLLMEQCDVDCPIFTGILGSAIFFNCTFMKTISIGTNLKISFLNSYWDCGANTAIDFQASGSTISLFDSSINTSASPAIAGSSGTMIASNVSFEDNSLIAAGITLSSQSKNLIGGAMFFSGTGAPGMVAPQGSLYMRLDGSGIADRAYVNTNGSTAWTNVVTAS